MIILYGENYVLYMWLQNMRMIEGWLLWSNLKAAGRDAQKMYGINGIQTHDFRDTSVML